MDGRNGEGARRRVLAEFLDAYTELLQSTVPNVHKMTLLQALVTVKTLFESVTQDTEEFVAGVLARTDDSMEMLCAHMPTELLQ